MDLIQNVKLINLKIKQLDDLKDELESISINKAKYLAEYEKKIASVLIALKNGRQFKLDEEIIINPPASIMEKISRGICWKELLDKDGAETGYKNHLKKIDIIQAQLNGFQSINRYLRDNIEHD